MCRAVGNVIMQTNDTQTGGQSYQGSTIVSYISRVVPDYITTLDS